MEVHHHPHLHHKKKNFREYIFEFVMLFLAVFLGFIAENIRVKQENKKKEREYIYSLEEDIKTDTAQLRIVIDQLIQRDKGIDTLLTVLKDPSVFTNSNRIFRLRKNLGFRDFIYTDRTIQQLKSTGEFRLIHKIEVSNKIISYDADARNIISLDNILNDIISDVLTTVNHILDFTQIEGWSKGLSYEQLIIPAKPIPLLISDQKQLISFYNSITDYKRFALGFKKTLAEQYDEGKSLLIFLKKEYRLK